MKNKFFIKSDIEEIILNASEEVMQFSGKTVILTGALGFLGRYFLEIFSKLNNDFLTKPCKVRAFDNLITGSDDYMIDFDNHIRFEKLDVIKPIKYNSNVDYIIHAAGIASPFYYRAHPLEALDVAIHGARNFLDLAKEKNARFTFFSSSEIYGDPDSKHVPIQESYRGNVSTLGPRSCYDESKRLAETLCYIYHDTFGVSTNIIRPFNIYGPGMQENDYRLFPNIASLIKAGEPIHVYGSGEQTRTFCYITDALVGFIKSITKGVPGEAYNVGNPTPEVSVLEVLKYIEKVLEKSIEYITVEHPDSYPADEPQRRCPDIKKANLQLGYRPVVDLEEGLRRYFRWTEGIYSGKLNND